MGYRMMGRGHVALVSIGQRLRSQRGQGTVEYVALILLVAMVMAAVATATTDKSGGLGIAKKVTGTLKNAIDSAGGKKAARRRRPAPRRRGRPDRRCPSPPASRPARPLRAGPAGRRARRLGVVPSCLCQS